MTLNDLVLQKLADWRPPGHERSTLTIPDEGSGWSLALTADRCDELGCLAWELTLQPRADLATRQGATLTSWARQAAERVRGLLEPLKVVEIDLERNEAILRSVQPTQRGDKAAYYELFMNGTRRATLRRYQVAWPNGQRREQVAFALTHETLAKVVTDLAGAL
jgi:hypothetical protein